MTCASDLARPIGPGRYAAAPSLNAWIPYGADTARTLHDTGDVTRALTRAKAEINPHLNYADCDAYGYCIVRLTSDRLDAEFVTVPEPPVDYGKNESPVRRRVNLGLPLWQGGEQAEFSHLRSEGEEPLLGLKWKDQERKA